MVASLLCDGGAADEKEGDVGADRGGDFVQVGGEVVEGGSRL